MGNYLFNIRAFSTHVWPSYNHAAISVNLKVNVYLIYQMF